MTAISEHAAPGPGGVVAVMAVKRLDEAKSRLAASLRVPGTPHGTLVLAMLADTLAAVRAAGVERVVVVSPDDDVLVVAQRAGAVGLREEQPRSPDTAADRLNHAFSHAHAAAAARWPDAGRIVFIQADLPAATATSLREVLAAAALHPQALLTDRDGTGTTILVRDTDILEAPRFGPNSAAAHRDSGAVDLDPTQRNWLDLRTDVDTAADLEAARLLGCGPHTTAELSRRATAAGAPQPVRRCG
ncbi:2-phospho-L-lactate guanylyltransferase [Gordonia sp. CPCC 205515]|uniref:2-phospho-L-lactate guanylyltransferase n=1 Tax=Gordonia sp. CPCC 205515 TaxID=3140791 RepID=UPI003AF3DBE3